MFVNASFVRRSMISVERELKFSLNSSEVFQDFCPNTELLDISSINLNELCISLTFLIARGVKSGELSKNSVGSLACTIGTACGGAGSTDRHIYKVKKKVPMSKILTIDKSFRLIKPS